MNGLGKDGEIVVAALALLVGLAVAGFGATRSDPGLFWGGLFLAVVGILFGRPRDPTAAIDDRIVVE